MGNYRFHHHQRQHQRLVDRALFLNREDCHLRHLIGSDHRMADFSAAGGGIFLDYSRQRVDDATMALLFELAEAAAVMDQFGDMANGKKVNVTENRAALHMAARSFTDLPIRVDGHDIKPDLRAVRTQIKGVL